MRRVEVGCADIAHLAFPAHLVQPAQRFEIAGQGVVPPVKLHQVELLGFQLA